ncbi:MAG: glycosyltransferase [Solirubrobacterales bacterium]|nr:glycosyltransferase [Solirubrobacterales bacterium]
MAEEPIGLSLVLPVHRGAQWIELNLSIVLECLERVEDGFELVVVCDGDDDLASEGARRIAARDHRVNVFHYPCNQGKGFAISFGVAQSRGRLIGWLDADLDIAPEVIVRAVASFAASEIDAAIGSKRHEASAVTYPAIRRCYSWGYQLLVRSLFRLSVRDTQVGAKVFRREMLTTVVPLLLVKRWAFDLEVLAVGAQFGFDRVVEVPVQLTTGFSGTNVDWRAVRNMLLDTLAIGYRLHLRNWYAKRFASLQRTRGAARFPAAPRHLGRLETTSPESIGAAARSRRAS